MRSPRDTSTRKPLETGCSFWVRVIIVIAHSPWGWVKAQRCAATLPVGETGVARARAAGVEGDHPPKGARGTRASARAWRSWLHEDSATARKTGETTPAGAGFGASPFRARGRSP